MSARRYLVALVIAVVAAACGEVPLEDQLEQVAQSICTGVEVGDYSSIGAISELEAEGIGVTAAEVEAAVIDLCPETLQAAGIDIDG